MSQNIVKAPIAFSYNGSSEYPFDVRDADDSEKFEKAIEELQEAEKLVAKDGKLSGITRANCKLIKDFFGTCLSAEAVEEFFGGKDNLLRCNEAYVAFLNMVAQQRDEAMKLQLGLKSMQGNRAQRRQRKRKRGGKK